MGTATLTTPDLTVYYDGLCPLCSREIAYYRKRAPEGAVRFVDIAATDFDAREHGLDPLAVRRVMHVKAGDEIRTGVDAFIAMWEAMPTLRWMARIAKIPGVRALLGVGYHAFAKVRPLLPRRKQPLCETGACER
jgi:predicted DCC family thiol-disulfide oxidoreductase YuxK